MAEPKYRLTYFDLRGIGEPIRMIFAYSGVPFTDDRIPWDIPTWMSQTKQKFNDSVGQIPVLCWEDKQLSNSQVISRYLAKQFKLGGSNDWEDAQVDEVVAMVHDLFILWRTIMFEKDPQRKAIMKTTYLDPKFKLYYAKWSKILQANSKGPFVLGDKVTHSDFWLANFISIWDKPMSGTIAKMPPGMPTPSDSDIYVGLTEEFPLLKKHLEAVENIPQIKEWINKRHNTSG